MKKDQILSYVVMGCSLLIIASVFMPYVAFYGISTSLWKAESPARVLYILFALVVIAVYLFNKKTELSYLVCGAGIFNSIANIISYEGLDYFKVAFYFIFLASIAIGVITFLYNEKEGVAIIKLNGGNKNIQPVQPQPVQQIQPAQPVQPTNPVTQEFVQQPIDQNNNLNQ